MKLKVLPLKHWMKQISSFDGLEEINPIIKKDGFYFDRETNKCWFEKNGNAYLCEKSDFEMELEEYNCPYFREVELDYIEFLIKSKLLNRHSKILKEYRLFKRFIENRNMIRKIRADRLKSKKYHCVEF